MINRRKFITFGMAGAAAAAASTIPQIVKGERKSVEIELVDLGTPADGNGDTIRDAFAKLNRNLELIAKELGDIS